MLMANVPEKFNHIFKFAFFREEAHLNVKMLQKSVLKFQLEQTSRFKVLEPSLDFSVVERSS
jgi:hypothetical protein